MIQNDNSRSYEELIRLNSYDERLNYLKLFGKIGEDTFGFDRYLNQRFYRSAEWKRLRKQIFIRDNGCDMGLEGYDILNPNSVIIHHINSINLEDLNNHSDRLMNPNNLITVSRWTHNLIHFGDVEKIPVVYERTPNDTCPWKMR